jgi:hypothetical protein
MQAQSLVGSARSLDRQADAVLDERRLDPTLARRAGLDQLSTLGTLDALVAAGTPLPVTDAETDCSDEVVLTLLDRLYETGSLNRAGLDSSLCERAARTDRVSAAGPSLLVPLGTEGPTGRNWRPVFRLLVDRLDETAADCERVVARTEGLSEAPVAERVWQSTVATLEETRTLLKTHLARQERLHQLYTRPSSEPAEFATWTIEQLSDARTEL